MRLMELKDVVKKSVRKKKKGKNLDAKSIQTVLEKLEAKRKAYEESLADPASEKERKKREFHLKVAAAQIEKARKLLKDLEEEEEPEGEGAKTEN